jgi:glycosyltransferase involved in cell wall biosynthesis
MAFACPSVTTSVGGIPEVVDHNLNGLLVPFGDVDALARAASSLVADPAHRKALGTAAQQKALTTFSAATIVSEYLALYWRVK